MEKIIETMKTAFLTAEWRNLLMANFEVDSSLLKNYLPFETELDSYNGVHYLSLVAFLFKNVKLKGIPPPFHRNFEEVNLRFYVRHKENNSWKRGVVFIREIVPKRMITFVANNLYKENYTTLPMKHEWDFSKPDKIKIEYSWQTEMEWNYIRATVESKNQAFQIGSIEEFITEHYWGYSKVNGNTTSEYKVNHPRWNIHKVINFDIKCAPQTIFGEAFSPVLAQKPLTVFLAEGSSVSVMNKTLVKSSNSFYL